jgi:hypothetical protein
MTDEINNPPDEDEDIFEDWVLFEDELYDALSGTVKKFLNDYYGSKFFDLQAETYRDIEQSIKDDFLFSADIPEVLYKYRKSTDEAKLDEIFDKFIASKRDYPWISNEQYYSKNLNKPTDEEEEFLGHLDPEEMTEDQKKAAEIINIVDSMERDDRRVARFYHSGHKILTKAIKEYLEKNANFDLAVLSSEGYQELADTIDYFINNLLENLDDIIYGDLGDDIYK